MQALDLCQGEVRMSKQQLWESVCLEQPCNSVRFIINMLLVKHWLKLGIPLLPLSLIYDELDRVAIMAPQLSKMFAFFTRKKPSVCWSKNICTCERWKDKAWGNFAVKWNEGRNYWKLFLPKSVYLWMLPSWKCKSPKYFSATQACLKKFFMPTKICC